MSDFWIRAWSNDGYSHYKNEEEHGSDVLASQIYVYVYGALTFAFFAIQIIRTGLMFYGVPTSSLPLLFVHGCVGPWVKALMV